MIYINIYIYIYIYTLNYFNTTCPPDYHHNGFVATGALEYTQVRLNFAAIQETKDCSSYH